MKRVRRGENKEWIEFFQPDLNEGSFVYEDETFLVQKIKIDVVDPPFDVWHTYKREGKYILIDTEYEEPIWLKRHKLLKKIIG